MHSIHMYIVHTLHEIILSFVLTVSEQESQTLQAKYDPLEHNSELVEKS